ncbi:hypothetical protein D6U78_10755 [Vibrio cholerae]|uniref:hypothetical protein n=1 Tax=Vibrio cholerae TaxID=666 RepID=UPI000E651C74|nr:hypothetical protein [Vibrio cholerae]MBY4641901.1 hypothetical protein [Vibrio cholerae]MCR9658173.1 hypothetical protein [Vibrio cholerae]MCR9688854.1 hypothetical protein [Vibrio cholerae]MCR9737362.1 hypothetical protein [Vibrio cholerae]MCR9746185.1 hypothetical protein [Vibrio cholerae]
MSYIYEQAELEGKIQANSVFASNGFMNSEFEGFLNTLRKANKLISNEFDFNPSAARSPFERVVMEFVYELNIDNLISSFGLKMKQSIGAPISNFHQRFNAVTFNLGQGLSTQEKISRIYEAGFTNDALAFENELTKVYKQLHQLILSSDSIAARDVTTADNQRWAYNECHLNANNTIGQQEYHSTLKQAFAKLVGVYFDMFEEDRNKTCGFEAIMLAFDYAAAAHDDIFVLNSWTGDGFYEHTEFLSKLCGPVNHARLQVLLQSSQGFFSFNTYVKYFFSAKLRGEANFDTQVLLPSQYLMYSMLSVKEKFTNEFPLNVFSLFIAIVMRYYRILKPSNNTTSVLEKLHELYGDVGMFSIAARNHKFD